MSARPYMFRTLKNEGADPDFPPAQYPLILFIAYADNPLASCWAFCTSQEHLNKLQADLSAQAAAVDVNPSGRAGSSQWEIGR